MKSKTKKPIMPKLPKTFTNNLEAIARGLHGKPFSTDLTKEWKLKQKEADELLQYLYDTGMITLKWIPEKRTLCILKKELVN